MRNLYLCQTRGECLHVYIVRKIIALTKTIVDKHKQVRVVTEWSDANTRLEMQVKVKAAQVAVWPLFRGRFDTVDYSVHRRRDHD